MAEYLNNQNLFRTEIDFLSDDNGEKNHLFAAHGSGLNENASWFHACELVDGMIRRSMLLTHAGPALSWINFRLNRPVLVVKQDLLEGLKPSSVLGLTLPNVE